MTRDAFLGGQLYLWQPKSGYRAGTDPVLLAAAVKAESGQTVLDVGCGVGTAGYCLLRRVPGVHLSGLEVQESYADLARRNAHENGIVAQIVTGDLASMPECLRSRVFDHVITNPPFYSVEKHTPPQDTGRETAQMATLPTLADWIRPCLKRVRPKGQITLIHRVEALPEILATLNDVCGNIEVFPITSRIERTVGRVIVTARKASRGVFILHAPLVMHDGESHKADCNDYSARAEAILRNGAPVI